MLYLKAVWYAKFTKVQVLCNYSRCVYDYLFGLFQTIQDDDIHAHWQIANIIIKNYYDCFITNTSIFKIRESLWLLPSPNAYIDETRSLGLDHCHWMECATSLTIVPYVIWSSLPCHIITCAISVMSHDKPYC